jgi:hypothetical protein
MTAPHPTMAISKKFAALKESKKMSTMIRTVDTCISYLSRCRTRYRNTMKTAQCAYVMETYTMLLPSKHTNHDSSVRKHQVKHIESHLGSGLVVSGGRLSDTVI